MPNELLDWGGISNSRDYNDAVSVVVEEDWNRYAKQLRDGEYNSLKSKLTDLEADQERDASLMQEMQQRETAFLIVYDLISSLANRYGWDATSREIVKGEWEGSGESVAREKGMVVVVMGDGTFIDHSESPEYDSVTFGISSQHPDYSRVNSRDCHVSIDSHDTLRATLEEALEQRKHSREVERHVAKRMSVLRYQMSLLRALLWEDRVLGCVDDWAPTNDSPDSIQRQYEKAMVRVLFGEDVLETDNEPRLLSHWERRLKDYRVPGHLFREMAVVLNLGGGGNSVLSRLSAWVKAGLLKKGRKMFKWPGGGAAGLDEWIGFARERVDVLRRTISDL